MSYSREEIEKKRLLALKRKNECQSKIADSPNVNKLKSNVSLVVNTIKNSETGSASTSKSNIHGGNKYNATKRVFHNNASPGCMRNKQTERFNPIEPQTFFGQKSMITGRCYMINNERFALETSAYIAPIIETLKSIPNRAYDIKSKTWNFLLKDYETVMQKMINFKSDIKIIGLPNAVLQIFRKDNSTDIRNINLSDMDPTLMENLMPFQREGICYGISKHGRCLIADDMGLGKTVQALGIAYYYKTDWPLLIVVPSSVRYQWSEAIYTFLPSIPTQCIHHFTNTKDFLDDDKIIITSYDLLVRALGTFEKRTFGFIILDESHTLKSIKTARYKAAQRIASHARHVVLLSGTPALSRPIELYSQINLIMRNFMGFQEYGIRYCAGEKTSFGWDFQGSSNMQELQILLKQCCMIRRLKSEVLNQLPTKRREVVMLDRDLIKAGTKEMENMCKKLERKGLSGIERHSALIEYYNESAIAKQKAICDYVTTLFKIRKKCLIFAHHQIILDSLCDVAESMKIKYIRIDGKTNPERRKYQVDKFQNCSDYLAAILSITAANSGITLTAAQLVVFAELFWNPGILCQAEDRVHRIGQDDNVVIQYLVAKQTADDYMWPLIQRKMNVLNEAGLDQDYCLQDVSVKKQALDTKQRTLNFSLNDNEPQDTTHKDKVESAVSQSSSSTNTENFQELLELDDEDFELDSWDEMDLN